MRLRNTLELRNAHVFRVGGGRAACLRLPPYLRLVCCVSLTYYRAMPIPSFLRKTYVRRQADYLLWHTFDRLCRRDNRSMSSGITEAVRKWVREETLARPLPLEQWEKTPPGLT